jgi:hypothetical protein
MLVELVEVTAPGALDAMGVSTQILPSDPSSISAEFAEEMEAPASRSAVSITARTVIPLRTANGALPMVVSALENSELSAWRTEPLAALHLHS